jgi:hypothetical protein
MRFSHTLLVAAMSFHPEISIFDSTVHKGKSWIMVDQCAVEVNTRDLMLDEDAVIRKVNYFCDLDLKNVSEKK